MDSSRNTPGTRRYAFCRGDAVIVIGILILAVLWGVLLTRPKTRGMTVEVRVAGQGVTELPLAKDTVYDVAANGYHLTVEIAHGEVRVRDANCPDRVCVETGAIHQAGRMIVCAPAGVTVRVIGARGEGQSDAVAG